MSGLMMKVGIAVYAACVDFLLKVSAGLGITYRDANAALFFLIWPVVTGLLVLLVLGQAWALRRR